MPDFIIPGVYIEEASQFPASVVSVATAIPAFIGYTQKAQQKEENDLLSKPWRIESMLEYEQYFGFADFEKNSLSITFSGPAAVPTASVDESKRSVFILYYAMQLYFANGGGTCWIIAAGLYTEKNVSLVSLGNGLTAAEKMDDATLLLVPDAMHLATAADYYSLYKQAIDQCARLQDRFTILDIYLPTNSNWQTAVEDARTKLAGTDGLKFAAAYFPRLHTSIKFNYNEEDVEIKNGPATAQTLAALKNINNTAYFSAKNALSNLTMLLPSSPALAGVYNAVDNSRGVWKAPANINLLSVAALQYVVNDTEQQTLNISTDGLSVNTIRAFAGRGAAIVWGARTLDGNSQDWRYISVRRSLTMIEKSVTLALSPFVFEPNDANTWITIKSMINNYLTQLWKSGALQGSKPEEAFFVRAGLAETMTAQDILDGRLVVTIGVATLKPAEFIIINIQQILCTQ